MKKRIPRLFAVILVAVLVLAYSPAVVQATHGFGSTQLTVIVDGQPFTLWGYDGDGPMPAFRLQDVAYVLNGTAAQFEIREPDGGGWEYWIVRGEAYTVRGTEFQPIPERHASFGSYGFAGGIGFYVDPIQSAVLGVDGEDEPATAIPVTVIRDVDDTYFPLGELAHLLGFTFEMSWDFYDGTTAEITTGRYPQTELPVHPPAFADLLIRLSGHWVDRLHFYGTAIDERVVWPVEFEISPGGMGFTDIVNWSVAPVRQLWEWPSWWYPLSMRSLDGGYVELTVDITGQARVAWSISHANDDIEAPHRDITRFYNHRIVVDAGPGQIDEIKYFIGDEAFTMVRAETWVFQGRDARRYHAVPAAGGGITLRYVLRPASFSVDWDREIRVYRSTERGEIGVLLFEQEITDPYDRLFFEFTDAAAEFGQVYYYSLWVVSERGFRSNITPVDAWPYEPQMAVDVNAVLGEPAFI